MNSINVMVVEDDPNSARFIMHTLEHYSYRVSCLVTTGVAAIENAATHRPDIILMDIMLEGRIDGVEAARQIHRRFRIPIIYLTAYSADVLVERAKTSGAFCYLLKPFKEVELHATIQMVLNRYKAEQLQESEDRFLLMAEWSPMMIWMTSPYQDRTFVNKQLLKFIGKSTEKQLGFGWLENIHPDDYDRYRQTLRNAHQLKKHFTCDYRIKRVDGNYSWVRDQANPRLYSDGQFAGLIGITLDINDQKQTEHTFEMQLQRVQSLYGLTTAKTTNFEAQFIESLKVGVRLVGLDVGVLFDDNFPTPRILYSYIAAPSMDTSIEAILHPLELLEFTNNNDPLAIHNLMESSYYPHLEEAAPQVGCCLSIPLLLGVQRLGTLSFFGFAARDHAFSSVDMEMLKFLGLCIGGVLARQVTENTLNEFNQDLTRHHGELNDTKIELNVTHQRLQETNQYALRILSLVGQQVGSTLHGVSGFTTLLKDEFYGSLNDKQKECIEQINKGANHLLAMIGSLSDLYKVNMRTITFEMKQLNLAEVIETVQKSMQSGIVEKELKVNVAIADPEKLYVNGDLQRVKQILAALLNNAIKYSPTGGEITIRGEMAEDNMVYIEIGDQGVGIPEDKLEFLFSEFYHVDPIRDNQMGGIGIGLALARHLVELHSGKIGYKHGEDKGSLFWVRLPCSLNLATGRKAPGEPEINEQAPEAGHRVLVVDDNEMNLAILVEMLMIEHYTVLVAKNGAEAIEMAEKNNPELILMDLFMPVMDGFEATRYLRAQEKYKNLPIVAISASADQQTIDDSLAAGCTEHLAKPVQLKHLFELLRRIFK